MVLALGVVNKFDVVGVRPGWDIVDELDESDGRGSIVLVVCPAVDVVNEPEVS